MGQTTDEQLAELKKQVALLQTELELAKAQSALAAMSATAAKDKIAAETALQSEQAKAALAELSGIKAALSGTSLPAGKSGTIQVTAGTPGAALLRSKGPMLDLLDGIAGKLAAKFPEATVIVTDQQLNDAVQARFTAKRLDVQRRNLDDAINKIQPPPPEVARDLASFAALAYSAGFVLDTANSLGRMFRTDRSLSIFSADEEAAKVLGLLLEAKSDHFLADATRMTGEASTQADELFGKLQELFKSVSKGEDVQRWIQLLSEQEKKDGTPPEKSKVSPQLVLDLKTQIDSAKSLLDSLSPDKAATAFWNQVKGQVIDKVTADKNRLVLDVKAQAIQAVNSVWYRADSISTSGEVEVTYRCYLPTGARKCSGVILRSTDLDKIDYKDAEWRCWPKPPPEVETKRKEADSGES